MGTRNMKREMDKHISKPNAKTVCYEYDVSKFL